MDLDDLLEEFKDEKNSKATTINALTTHQPIRRGVSDWDDDSLSVTPTAHQTITKTAAIHQ